MQTLPESISRALDASIAPVYVLKFGDLAGDSIPYYYSTAPVVGLSTVQNMAAWPKLPARKVTPLEGKSTIGKGGVVLLDLGASVSDLLSQHSMVDRPATLYFLLAGLHWRSRLTVYSGSVSDVSRAGLAGFMFTLVDPLSRLAVDVFLPEALASEPGSGDKVWTCSATGGATLTLSDFDGDGVYDRITVQGHPMNIALCLMRSGAGDGGTFDAWPAWAGAGLSTQEVNESAWETARDNQWSLAEMKFTLEGKERVKRFIESEICKVLGGYMTISGSGKIGCRFFEAPRKVAVLQSFTDDSLLKPPAWSGNYGGGVTHISISLDHDGDDYQTELPLMVSAECLAGRARVLNRVDIRSRGLQTSLGGVSIARTVADSIFRRYQVAPPKVGFEVMLHKLAVEAGDVVRLRSITYPNIEGSQPLGVDKDRLLEVYSVGVVKDRIKCAAIDVSGPLQSTEQVAIIAPNGQAVWTSATPAEKDYAYLADPDTKKMSDGQSGYEFA